MAAGQQVLMRALMLRGHAAGPASLSTIRHVRTQARAIRVVVVSLALLQNRLLFQAICPGSFWARDNRWLLSRVQRLAGPAGGTGAFCPGWRHQPG